MKRSPRSNDSIINTKKTHVDSPRISKTTPTTSTTTHQPSSSETPTHHSRENNGKTMMTARTKQPKAKKASSSKQRSHRTNHICHPTTTLVRLGLFLWFVLVLFSIQRQWRVDINNESLSTTTLRGAPHHASSTTLVQTQKSLNTSLPFSASAAPPSTVVSTEHGQRQQLPKQPANDDAEMVSSAADAHPPESLSHTTTAALQSLTADPHRYFGANPVTAEESRALSEIRNASSDLRIAVCHPTIFYESELGNVTSLEKFLVWVSYYRLLGFDHIFLWHLPIIRKRSWGFEQLNNLPYVTLTEGDFKPGRGYFGQLDVMRECLRKEEFGRNYDWVLLIDADEFLWYDTNHLETNDEGGGDDANETQKSVHPLMANSRDGKTPPSYHIKDWLIGNGYHEKYNYISFGKHIFTLLHSYVDEKYNKVEDFPSLTKTQAGNQMGAVNADPNQNTTTDAAESSVQIFKPLPRCPFGDLERFTFTAGKFCYRQKQANSCPDWKGRSKILMNPLQRGQGTVSVHGAASNLRRPRSIHMDTGYAHLKEWVRWLHQPDNATEHTTPDPFFVSNAVQVLTHSTMESHPRNNKDQVKFYHDKEWLPWLQALKMGFPDSPNLEFSSHQTHTKASDEDTEAKAEEEKKPSVVDVEKDKQIQENAAQVDQQSARTLSKSSARNLNGRERAVMEQILQEQQVIQKKSESQQHPYIHRSADQRRQEIEDILRGHKSKRVIQQHDQRHLENVQSSAEQRIQEIQDMFKRQREQEQQEAQNAERDPIEIVIILIIFTPFLFGGIISLFSLLKRALAKKSYSV